jgi:hypothetical protein
MRTAIVTGTPPSTVGTRQLLDRAAELLILLRQRLDDVAGYPISTG